MTTPVRVALTIAGSDSGAGAGVQADLKTFAALGVYGTSAITAITAQNTAGIDVVSELAADLVAAQIEAVVADMTVHATKTGMLVNAALVDAVAAAIAGLDLPNLVVDPVMTAKSGVRLLDEDGLRAMKSELLPRARIVTPNIPEAAVLAGMSIASRDDLREAARRVRRLGPSAVVVTGGHATGDTIVDLLFDGERFVELPTPRIQTRNTHGTGCTFASAIAAYLALDHSLEDAVRQAQAYVGGAIRHALALGRGQGPIDHLWQLRGHSGPVRE